MLKSSLGNVFCKVAGQHDFGEWKLHARLCEEIRICKRCALKEEKVVAHQWKEWELTPGRYCIESRRCKHCWLYEERQLEHKWDDWKISSRKFQEMHKCLNCGKEIHQVNMDLLPESVKAYIHGRYVQVENQIERDRFIQAFQASMQGDCVIHLTASHWVPADGGNEMSGKYDLKYINLSEKPIRFNWDSSALNLAIMWGEERIASFSSFHVNDFEAHKNYHHYAVTFDPIESEWGIVCNLTTSLQREVPVYSSWEKHNVHVKQWYGVRNW